MQIILDVSKQKGLNICSSFKFGPWCSNSYNSTKLNLNWESTEQQNIPLHYEASYVNIKTNYYDQSYTKNNVKWSN